MNNSQELILRKLSNDFQTELSKNEIIIEQKLVATGWLFKTESLIIESNLPHLESNIHSLINCTYGCYDINWANAKKFITTIADQTKENCLTSLVSLVELLNCFNLVNL